MADPIFDVKDKPGTVKKPLPPELVGKSPEEIAEYYERKHEIVMNNAREIVARNQRTPPPKADPPKPAEDDKIDIYNDPTSQIKRLVETKINEASATVTARLQPNMVASCKIEMRERHRDFPRFQQEVEAAMARMLPEAQMDPEMWNVAYLNVKGRHADELIAEGIAEAKKPKNPVEMPTHSSAAPTRELELTDEEKEVAHKFDLSNEQYQAAKTSYKDGMASFPLTYDSRTPRKRRTS